MGLFFSRGVHSINRNKSLSFSESAESTTEDEGQEEIGEFQLLHDPVVTQLLIAWFYCN